MSVRPKPKRAANQPADSPLPLGEIVCADNLTWMRTLPGGLIDLVYIDPPFMTNAARGARGGLRYDDRWPGGIAEFAAFLEPRFVELHRLLAENGTLYVHVDPRTSHYLKVLLDGIFGADNFLNEIIWSYRTGGRSTRWFARKHDVLLVYARSSGKHAFNVIRDGAFRTDGLVYDEEGKPYKNTRKGRLYFHADGPALTDVWEIPFLSTVARERTGYPSQKPEALLERVIRASSNPGDVVADVFCGSGTTLAVAQRLGRKWLGCDASPDAAEIARKRLGRAGRNGQ
ncbi:MAG: site-specific DNA-methyltransferase [Phycisphaerales bacterium]|nr:site-specific DNA-methyltransferase [Phycisphaerales bacterium]